MKLFKYSKLTGAFFAMVLFFSVSSNVFAYNTLNNHVITNGISGQFYYVQDTDYWRTAFNSGFTKWYNTSTPFSFSRTSNQSAAIVDCYTYSANDNANGYTAFFINSSSVNPTTVNWYWCEVKLNKTYLSGTTADYDSGVVCHELGHVMGLNENNSNTRVIMCQAGSGRSVTTPQQDDINGINYLY
jgi:hypothetical protein